MKYFKISAAQGELSFERLPDNTPVPAGAQKVEAVGKQVIIGHSEIGHHHVMDADCVTFYRLPDSITDCLLIVEKPDALKHLRDYDTHEPLAFETGRYRVTHLREYTPDGWRKQID